MHRHATSPKLTAYLLPVAVTDSGPDREPDPTSALALSIAKNIPGSYVEKDDAGNDRVVYPAAWLRDCGRALDSITDSLERDMRVMRRELGRVA